MDIIPSKLKLNLYPLSQRLVDLTIEAIANP
jgi:hypothetical protein